MGSYIPSTYEERLAMLREIGMDSMDDLFSALPESIKVKELSIPSGLSELEVSKRVRALAGKNRVYGSIFRGAGAYNHHIRPIMHILCVNDPLTVTNYAQAFEDRSGARQAPRI